MESKISSVRSKTCAGNLRLSAPNLRLGFGMSYARGSLRSSRSWVCLLANTCQQAILWGPPLVRSKSTEHFPTTLQIWVSWSCMGGGPWWCPLVSFLGWVFGAVFFLVGFWIDLPTPDPSGGPPPNSWPPEQRGQAGHRTPRMARNNLGIVLNQEWRAHSCNFFQNWVAWPHRPFVKPPARHCENPTSKGTAGFLGHCRRFGSRTTRQVGSEDC